MRKLTILFFLVCWGTNMQAQEYWSSQRPNHRLCLGIRAGMNISKQYNMGDGADNDFRLGFRAGVELDLNVVQSFSVNTGAFYIQKGYKTDYSDYRGSLKTTDNASYLEIPLLASYRVKLSDAAQFQLNLGPYFAFGLSGKKKVKSTFTGQQDYDIDSFDEYDGLKKQDIGIHVGTAITFDNYYVGVSYERSLMNVSNVTNANYQNGGIGVTIGYNF